MYVYIESCSSSPMSSQLDPTDASKWQSLNACKWWWWAWLDVNRAIHGETMRKIHFQSLWGGNWQELSNFALVFFFFLCAIVIIGSRWWFSQQLCRWYFLRQHEDILIDSSTQFPLVRCDIFTFVELEIAISKLRRRDNIFISSFDLPCLSVYLTKHFFFQRLQLGK